MRKVLCFIPSSAASQNSGGLEPAALILRCEPAQMVEGKVQVFDGRASKDAHLQCFLDNSLVAFSSPASVSGYMRLAKISRIMAIEWV